MHTAKSRHFWVARWGEGVGRLVEAMSVQESGGQMTLLKERRENLKGT